MRRSPHLSVAPGLLMAMLLAVAAADANGVVRYEDFGAKGDGKADDLKAIVAAHAHANEQDLPVRASDGAVYRIGGGATPAVILTDTDFGNARFIIDDREVEDPGKPVFEIRSRLAPMKLKGLGSLERGQQRLPVTLSQPCLVELTDDQVMRYIRRGGNRNQGKPQTEVILVGGDGRVAEDTPVLWGYKRISEATAYPLDQDLLTVRGGHFTTIANASGDTDYYARGISVRRSNVCIAGLEHHITGEGKRGAPYRGFIALNLSARVEMRDVVFSGHKVYHKTGSAGHRVPMGSYDIHLQKSTHVRFVNCRQANSIHDRKYWGLMGTNYCKNLSLERCRFSRFDAHMGVCNVTITNSELGHMGIKAIGFGLLRVENTAVHSSHFIDLRRDYGSTWQGEILIRNGVFHPRVGKGAPLALIGGFNDGQHDFGYPCHLPDKVSIDGMRIDDSKMAADSPGLFVFDDFNPGFTAASPREKHPLFRPRQVVARGVRASSGQSLKLSVNEAMFAGVKFSR